MEATEDTIEVTLLEEVDPRISAWAARRRDGIEWVETFGIEIIRNHNLGRSRIELGQSWIGSRNDPRDLLLEAYEGLHPLIA